MSTRCNVIIKNSESRSQVYHHHDGYPSGVGAGLLEYFHNMTTRQLNSYCKSPENVARYLSMIDDDEYEFEYEINLHWDIDYLYVIDLDERKLYCYYVDIDADKYTDDAYIEGTVDDSDYEDLEFIAIIGEDLFNESLLIKN